MVGQIKMGAKRPDGSLPSMKQQGVPAIDSEEQNKVTSNRQQSLSPGTARNELVRYIPAIQGRQPLQLFGVADYIDIRDLIVGNIHSEHAMGRGIKIIGNAGL